MCATDKQKARKCGPSDPRLADGGIAAASMVESMFRIATR